MEQLFSELEVLRARLRESEETLNAIRNGEVDAIVVSGKGGERIFTLTSAETPYRIILEEMSEGAAIVSTEGLVLYCNRSFSEFVSTTREQITGSRITRFISRYDRARFNKLLRASLKKRTKGVISCVSDTNRMTHGQFSFVASLPDMEGSVCIVVSDITEIREDQNLLQEMVDKRTGELEEANRQLSENLSKLEMSRRRLAASSKKYRLLYNKRKEAEKDLENSQKKLEIALESGHIGIWERNLRNDEVIWDNRMEHIFNLETGTFGGNYASFENLIDEEDLPHLRNAIDRALETGYLLETIFRTRSGSGNSKYISTKALVNRDEHGTPISLTGICFDVTALKKGAEKAIVKLNEELLRSNKELESFAYVASHDLQEPLRMVSSFTQMLEKKYKGQLDQDAQDYIRFAVDGAKRMYQLINGLLEYSRVHSKGKDFVIVNMEGVFEKVTRNLERRINEKNVVLTKNDLPEVLADESQMIQLVQNLVENGIKFSPSHPRIHFSSNANTDYYGFSVKDEGMGIEPQYFERIFRIFQRLMPNEEYEGTGIGLSICKRIVERHNGKIWVESEPGRGSTFFFTIPR